MNLKQGPFGSKIWASFYLNSHLWDYEPETLSSEQKQGAFEISIPIYGIMNLKRLHG